MLLIYAYDAFYGGLHGMNDYRVIDDAEASFADEIGVELSCDVINSYGYLEEEIYEEDNLEELIAFEVYRIKPSLADNKTIEDIEEIINKEGVNIFIDEYCCEVE